MSRRDGLADPVIPYFNAKTLESSPEAVVTVSMANPERLPLGTVAVIWVELSSLKVAG